MSLMKHGAFIFYILLLALVADAQKVKQVSFMHRHGARDEPLVIDGKLEWKFAQLTSTGETMVLNLGRLLRATYGTFITSFDPAEYEALTGDSGRCIQSAHGVLQGFFDEARTFTPLIKHLPFDKDWLMTYNINFSNLITRQKWRDAFQNNDTLARKWLNSDEIALLADTFGSWCKDTPMLCALFAADAIQCRISNTKSTSAALQTLFDNKLLFIQYESDKYNYGFYPSDPYAVIGSAAYDFAAKVMRDASEGDKKVYHYSSHDINVLAALNTFGIIQVDQEDHKWLPRFGAVFAVTTYTDGNVSFHYAEPEQGAASTLDYTSGLQPVSARCETAAGVVYAAPQCPVADAWRHVNRSGPTVGNRYCFLRPEDQCHTPDEIPPEPFRQYREHCPKEACGPKAVLDASKGYVCVSFGEHQRFKSYALAAVLSGVIAFLLGLFFGLVFARLLGKMMTKEEERRVLVENAHV